MPSISFNSETEIKKLKNNLTFITEQMLRTRPVCPVVLRPYTVIEGVTREVMSWITCDIKAIYPNSKPGNLVYIGVGLLSQYDTDIWILSVGAKKLVINGVEAPVHMEGGIGKTQVHLNEGKNEVLFKCVCGDDFQLKYVASHLYYPGIWSADYLLWLRDTIPLTEYDGEQGIAVSPLLRNDADSEYEQSRLFFPMECKTDDGNIALREIFDTGRMAALYSVIRQDGEFAPEIQGAGEIYINGRLKTGNRVKAGDEVLLIVTENDSGWGVRSDTTLLHLPMVESGRKNRLHWLILGPLTDKTEVLKRIQFKETYTGEGQQRIFWRFAEKNTYLRPYLDSSFYGQWFYGLMVGEYGLLRASRFDSKYYDYFRNSMRVLTDYHWYMQYDAALFGDVPFLKRSVAADDLDSIGTIGMNLCELYLREEEPEERRKIMSVLSRLTERVFTHIPRMEDGTFYRGNTLWADDSYMCCPFLVRMGCILGQTKYFDEVAAQLKRYTEKLYIEDGMYSHIYFPQTRQKNNIPWGRGNGWVYLAFAEVLEHLPETHSMRGELMDIFKEAVSGLIRLQESNGLWHQVLNRPDSYLETSCTGLFTVAISKGIKMGILEKEIYAPVVRKAVEGLLNYSVDSNGNILHVCRGSGCSADVEYYAELKTHCNDDHGTGIVLAAICELIELLEQRYFV